MDVSQGMRILIPGIFLLVLAACSDTDRRYIPDQVLVPILRDLHYARASTYNMASSEGDSLYEDLKLQVCLLHGVSPDSLDHDLGLLLKDPKALELVYEVLIDSLESSNVQAPAAY